MSNFLSIGDEVLWRGGWGKDPAKVTKVTSIEVCQPGNKYGNKVSTVEWEGVLNGNTNIVVDLSNGHWAYGSQINPVP